MKNIKCVFLVLISIGCQTMNKDIKPELCFSGFFYQEIREVKIDDISKIKQLNGKFVQIQGTLHYSFEDVAIYPIGSNNSSEGAFWLNFRLPDDTSIAYLRELNGKKVKLIGRINLSNKGHLEDYKVTLDSVFCIK